MAKIPKRQAWLPSLKGIGKQRQQGERDDKQQRTAAGNAANSVILSAKDVQGHYDVQRLLHTTLGGAKRALTLADLATFQRNIAAVQRRYKGGISAKQVLDLSTAIDRQRANAQIHSCVVVSAQGETLRFLTNAGPDSKDSHHHVTVRFLDLTAHIAGPNSAATRKSALAVRNGRLLIDCDCGRWRYWYRFVATVGKYQAGRAETGFPKIRNPQLKGVACKHLLRVCAEIEKSPNVLNYLIRLLNKARSQDSTPIRLQTTQKQAQQQLAKPGPIRDVEASRRARIQAKQRQRLHQQAQHKAPKQALKTNISAAALALGKAMNLTPAQIQQLIAANAAL